MLPGDCESWLKSKSNINRAGFALAEEPGAYSALRQVQCYRLFRALCFPDVIGQVSPILQHIPARVGGRLKRLPSIVRKINRDNSVDLARVADIVGFRIICRSFDDAVKIKGELESLPAFKKTQDYVSEPRPTGYRCFHVVLRTLQTLPGSLEPATFDVEIQVRTFWQHVWALISEAYGEQVKEGGGSQEIRRYLSRLGEQIAQHEAQTPSFTEYDFDQRGTAANVAVVRRVEGGAQRPIIMPFGDKYDDAAVQMISWEDDLGATDSETLLLVGVGDLKVLGVTHSVFLGAKSLPLPNWAEQPPRLSIPR